MKSLFRLIFASVLLQAWVPLSGSREAYPLPEERGTAGIMQALGRLPVFARVLWVQAHPDDESAGTLSWLARAAHARVAIYSLTRGEGGQNILGDEKYEALGLLREGEFREACRIYGVELHFGRAFDFGFSKSAEETLTKWGRDETLADLALFIRRWKPAVIISAFRGDASDGHGHHRASGILAREAFRAAADTVAVPGGQPWQAKKLYTRGAGGTAVVRAGAWDPVLGRSYRQIGAEGYSNHRTQGMGAAYAAPGRSDDSYRLLESGSAAAAHGDSLFEGIDTSLRGILDQAGRERTRLAFLEPGLDEVQAAAEEAIRVFHPRHPEKSLPVLGSGAGMLIRLQSRIDDSGLAAEQAQALRTALSEKHKEFEDAIAAVTGAHLAALADDTTAGEGEELSVNVTLHNRGAAVIVLAEASLILPPGWSPSNVAQGLPRTIQAGESATLRFATEIPAGAEVTETRWYRARPSDNRYSSRQGTGEPPARARALIRMGEATVELDVPVRARAGDPIRGVDFVDFQVVPALSAVIVPPVGVAAASPTEQVRELQVLVKNNARRGKKGSVRLHPPAGWGVEPASQEFSLGQKDEFHTARFRVRIPPATRPGSYTFDAVAVAGGAEYRRGYSDISQPGTWSRKLYSPSRAEVKLVDLTVPPGLTIGYVPGAGDEIPAALRQVGVRVDLLAPDDLAFGDLAKFRAIVTGIRAYNVNEALRAHNGRLLKYAEEGGTLVVQYNWPIRQGGGGGDSSFPYGPYPLWNSAAHRISVEESPMSILDPHNPVVTRPNRITVADFDGWIQERGSYFMSRWDPKYTPVLSGNDPGEEPKAGGLLVARCGKGWYVFTGHAWFRQLPAGVSGAYRLFINLLSLSATAK